MGSMMIKLCGSGCLIYLSTSHEFHDDQGLLWQCGKLTDLQQITKQIEKLEIHFGTIAYWAGNCYGNEVSVPVHRMSACAPVGCLPKKN
jgi:hypothetical protein